MTLRDEQTAADNYGSSMARHTKVIPMEAFRTSLAQHAKDNSLPIIPYLTHILGDYQGQTGCCLMLPSLECLSRLLRIPAQDIRTAFVSLKSQGYDSSIPSEQGRITVWIRPTTSTYRPTLNFNLIQK